MHKIADKIPHIKLFGLQDCKDWTKINIDYVWVMTVITKSYKIQNCIKITE